MTRLSIIVPLYNSAAYLPRCLDSLLRQDIPAEEYEILLVNDGSPDDSISVAEEYAAKHPQTRVFSKENGGTSSARNLGISKAVGTYLYFVDPDDYILENSLRDVLQKMDEESLDVLRFGYTEVDEQGNPTKSCRFPERPDYSPKVMDGYSFLEERLGTSCFVWTYLFRTSLIQGDRLFFDEKAYIDDTPWLPRVLARAARVDSVDVKRHFYTIRTGSLVRSDADKVIPAQQWLVEELVRQLGATDNAKGKRWYRKMIAHSVLTLLTAVGAHKADGIKDISRWLKGQGVLPLPLPRERIDLKVKTFLVNVSPRLYCELIHFRSGGANR